MSLEDIIAALKNAPRSGSAVDEPEGSRFVMLSETLASQMIAALEQLQFHPANPKDLSQHELDCIAQAASLLPR